MMCSVSLGYRCDWWLPATAFVILAMGQYCILLVIYGQRMGSMLTACHVIKYNVHTYNSIENLVTQI